MSRSEARIFTSIWDDKEFVALPPGAQRLYMFLLSQKDLAYCGVIPLRESRWAKKAAGLTADDIKLAVKVLEEGSAYPSENPSRNPSAMGSANPSGDPSANPDAGSLITHFVITDGDTGELFVRALIRRDGIWKQPNFLKLARKEAEQVESPRIRAAMLAELRRLPLEETSSDLVVSVIGEFIQDLENTLGNPSPNPSAMGSGMGGAGPSGDPSGDPSAHPSQGIGEGYGSSREDSPDPLFPGSPSMPAKVSRNGTRLPENFTVTAEMVEWCRVKCPHVDGKAETERFRDHWRGKPGKDGRKLDWAATWRNWMRTAEDRAQPRPRPAGRPVRGGQADDLSGEVYGQGRTRI